MRTCYIENFVNATKLALVEDGDLVELLIEKNMESVRVKGIFAGRVQRILPGMEACFVDIGSNLSGYLRLHPDRGIKVGDRIMVQVKKLDKENKRLTLDLEISMAGRGLVYIPRLKKIIFSKSISDNEVKKKIRAILPSKDFLVRTKAQEMDSQDLIKEANELVGQYEKLDKEFKKNSYIGLLRKSDSSILEYIRDNIDSGPIGDKNSACLDRGESDSNLMYRDTINSCHNIDDLSDREIDLMDSIVYSVYEPLGDSQYSSYPEYDFEQNLRKCIKDINPELLLKLDKKKNIDVFESYGINSKISKLRSKKVETDQGPYIVIDRTEALTVIDVNSGSFTGSSDYFTTVAMANEIAAKEIIRQILLRDLTGIILIDFIDMNKKSDRDKLVEIINQGLKKDERTYKLHGYTRLGLLEISRERKSRSVLDYYEGLDQEDFTFKPSIDSILDEIERRVQIEVYHKLNKTINLYEILFEYRDYEIEKILKIGRDTIDSIGVKYGIRYV